jgi:hypothetical protein
MSARLIEATDAKIARGEDVALPTDTLRRLQTEA